MRPGPTVGAAEQEDDSRKGPLVGREGDLARLVDAAGRAARDRRAAVLILEGDNGVGKTRLAEELLARMRLDGVVVAAVRAVEADREEEWSGILARCAMACCRREGWRRRPHQLSPHLRRRWPNGPIVFRPAR